MNDLTEQWKKGELLEGFYYVKCDWSDEVEIRYVHNSVDDWKAIIAPVPSYEELQNMNKAVNECMAANIKLVEQNKQLKKLLKELYKEADVSYCEESLLDKIDEALK